MSELLRSLGLTFGSRPVVTTTFQDGGLLPPDSPFRRAWAHVEPTIFGLLAASLRLLRDPYVVYALVYALKERNNQGENNGARTLIDHLFGLYSAELAIIFGDTQSAHAAREMLRTMHRRRIPADGQPDWFVEATGGMPHAYTVGDEKLKHAVQAAILAAVTRAHLASGVLIDGRNGYEYVRHAGETIAWGNDSPLFGPGDAAADYNPHTIQRMGERYGGVPLMGRDLLVRAGALEVLDTILDFEIAPGVPLSAFEPQITGLAFPDDRKALGLSWTTTDQEISDLWGDDYGEKVGRAQLTVGTPAAGAPVPADAEELNAESYFLVATGRFT